MRYSLQVSFTPTLCSDSSPSPTIDLRQRFSLCEIFKHAHLKFTVYGRKQASKQASIHTHMRNAVTLMWGSLMLAPMNVKGMGNSEGVGRELPFLLFLSHYIVPGTDKQGVIFMCK